MGGESHFGDRLTAAVRQKRSAVCVGLDPRWQSLPAVIRNGVDSNDLSAVAGATACYCREVIDAVSDAAPIVKPQAAFFEQLGPAGMAALADVIGYAKKVGLLVLLDGKRGDIGSTAEGYADAYLGEASAWKCDALTVNPYLGDDTLEPFIRIANQRGAGIFTLVKTSNAGSGFIQDLAIDGQTIFQKVASLVQQAACASKGTSAYGNVGAVVGATYPQQLADMRAYMPNAWILIPGFGAQGGTAADVAHGFDEQGTGAIVNSSRGIIFAYSQQPYSGMEWQRAVEQATRDMASQLPSVTWK
jgi:orotidine-5'-phosphate decarboxylase